MNEIKISANEATLTDGSKVWNVTIRQGNMVIVLPATSESAADYLVEELMTTIADHTNIEVWT